MKSFWQRSEVAQRFERQVLLLNLRPQAAEKIIDPTREVRVTPEQYLHTHGWRRQSSLLEDAVKSESYLCVCPGATDGLTEQRSSRRPNRQMRGKKKKRGVRDFLEGEHSARTHQVRQRTQDSDRIGKELQNETAHRCVERLVAGDLAHIGLREAHMVKASLGNSRSSPSDGTWVVFDAYNFSRRTNQVGHQHGDVTDAGTDVQDTLACTNAGFAEKPFGERSKQRGLPN